MQLLLLVMLSENNKILLSLVRLGIGHTCNYDGSLSNENLAVAIDWKSIKQIADEQGLSAIVLDGIEKMPENMRPPQAILLQWIGEVLQEYEARYQAYEKAIGDLAGFYNSHGFKMMVMKGYACSLDWPKPEHRPCGDIDIWHFGKQKEADELLKKEKSISVDDGEHQHTVFDWNDFMVENHYDFINTHTNKTNKELEPVLKKLAMDDRYHVNVLGEQLYLPSANFNALFLLRHMLLHFVAVGISIRHLLDWAFFWAKHGKEVDAGWHDDLLKKYHMHVFFNIINAICVEDLGFTANIFPCVQFNPEFKNLVLKEILSPEYDWAKAHSPNFISRLIFKFRRWKGCEWKRELCLGENSWTSFWAGAWSHLLKPKTI
jgi:hypothetical protein